MTTYLAAGIIAAAAIVGALVAILRERPARTPDPSLDCWDDDIDRALERMRVARDGKDGAR